MVMILSVTFVRSAVCLALSDGQKIWLTRSAYYESGWKANDTISQETLEQFVLFHQYPAALNQAVAMLARRPCSKGEIEQKLHHARFTPDVVELVIYKLMKANLLDDREFSAAWIRSRTAKYGSRRIYQELKKKGVNSDIAQEALCDLDEETEYASAVSLARKALSKGQASHEDPWKRKQRVIAALVRKGFPWDMAKKAYEEAEHETGTG